MIQEQEKNFMRLTKTTISEKPTIYKRKQEKIEELKEKVKSFEQENNDLQQKLLLAKRKARTNQSNYRNITKRTSITWGSA